MQTSIVQRFTLIAPIWLDILEKGLKPELQYHSIHHVLSVIERVEFIGTYEALDPEQVALIKVAALFHDSGFLEGPKEHELKSCEIVRIQLPQYGFNTAEIEHICAMIMATKIPQSPADLMGQVLCDADLDYLGTEDYDGPANQLRHELQAINPAMNPRQWLQLQINFLEKHSFFTNYARVHREPLKKLHLGRLRKQLVRLTL